MIPDWGGGHAHFPPLPTLPITGLTMQSFQTSTIHELSQLFQPCHLLKKLVLYGGAIAQVALLVLLDTTQAQPLLPALEEFEIRINRFPAQCELICVMNLLDARPHLRIALDSVSFVSSGISCSDGKLLQSKYNGRFVRLP